MTDGPFYHAGMRQFQDVFDGTRVADAIAEHHVNSRFTNEQKKIIEAAPFFFLASAWQDYVDCSVKCGSPGFVKVVSDNVLEYPEFNGNSMYRTMGNLYKNPTCGLLFVNFDGVSKIIRINGRASILCDDRDLSVYPGAKFIVRIECLIYPNCGRYLPKLNFETPPPDQSGTYHNIPAWKQLEYIRDILPHDDPHCKTGFDSTKLQTKI